MRRMPHRVASTKDVVGRKSRDSVAPLTSLPATLCQRATVLIAPLLNIDGVLDFGKQGPLTESRCAGGCRRFALQTVEQRLHYPGREALWFGRVDEVEQNEMA